MIVSGIIFAVVDTDAAAIESWNRWYDLEHLPPNIALPGILSGRRYVAPADLVDARLPRDPLAGFAGGQGLHLTIYLTESDAVEAIGAMTARRDELEAAGRMEGAGNRVVRAGDAMDLRGAVGAPELALDERDVIHVGHTALRVLLRRGGAAHVLTQMTDSAVALPGVHGVVTFEARFQAGVECDIFLLEGDPVELTEALREAAPYGDGVEVLLDAPFRAIVPFDYGFAEAIRQSWLPQTID